MNRTLIATLASLVLSIATPTSVLADGSSYLRVVVVKTADPAAYAQELEKAKAITARLGITVKTHVWRATFAGPDTGVIVVTQEYPSFIAFSEGSRKAMADPEYLQFIRNLGKIRSVISDSLYQEL